MASSEFVILVDEHDNEIGIIEKLLAHQQAKLHRAFSVFILRHKNNKLQTLLQQRQLDKYHSPGLWTNTCCSHPAPGEPVILAGQRRLEEEMGIRTELREIAAFKYKAPVGAGLIEHEFDHVLVGSFDNEHIPFDPQEVAASRWVDVDWLREDLRRNPEQYTAWFSEALELVLAELNKN